MTDHMSTVEGRTPFTRTTRAAGTTLVAVLLVLAAAAAFHGTSSGIATAPKPLAAASSAPDAGPEGYVQIAVAMEAAALSPLPVPARVAFDERRTASVGSPLAGRVEQVVVRPGDHVKAGDKLFSVRSAALADLDRDLKTARNDVDVKRRLAGRTRELAALQLVPEKDLLAADADLRDAELTLGAAEAKRQSLKVDIESDYLFWVTAPQDGTIVEQDVSASQEVTSERADALLRISDLREVVVLADIQERDVYDVRVGTPVTIDVGGGDVQRHGTLEHVSELVDPERRTVAARIRADNADGALRPNALVQVTLEPDASAKRILVPADAVVRDGQRSVVFVAGDKGELRRVRVQTGRERDGQLELRGGLAPGSRYVAKGATLLLNQVGISL